MTRRWVPNGEDLLETSATCNQVLKCLPDHPWIHFACHGLHNDDKPFESAFMLYDGGLTLRDFLTAHPGFSGLAFLSACETAAFSLTAPNEVLHLSAAVQFCGFANVIGTQWPVKDVFASKLADVFYRELFCEGNSVTLASSAEALHSSLMKLKDSGVPVEDLITFIHIGI